jgi:thymidylate synthase
MLAHLIGASPRKFVHVIADAHIYKTHIEAVKTQLSRAPKTPPTLRFKRDVRNIDDFVLDDFVVEGYEHHPFIKAEMAV